MAAPELREKLAILSDAAKYDASCASSGASGRNSLRVARHRLDRRHGHLPFLRAGRPLHLAAEDPAHQFLRLRLQLLHKPLVLERPPRPLQRRRGGAADHDLLPPQLHRRPVPVVRRHPLSRRDDDGDGRSRTPLARGRELRRLHPSQDDPGVLAGADRTGRPLRRPAVDQRRAADGRGRQAPGAGEATARRSGCRWPGCARSIEEQARADAENAGGARAFAPGRPVDADDHRRGRDRRTKASCRPARGSTAATSCGASTTPPSVPIPDSSSVAAARSGRR